LRMSHARRDRRIKALKYLGLALVILGFLSCIPLGIALSELALGLRYSPETNRQLLITGFAGFGPAAVGTVLFRTARSSEKRIAAEKDLPG
jgi:uncharacterized membrane protein